jgi:hypothetical protein
MIMNIRNILLLVLLSSLFGLLLTGCPSSTGGGNGDVDNDSTDLSGVEGEGEAEIIYLADAPTRDAEELMDLVRSIGMEFMVQLGYDRTGIQPTVVGEISHTVESWVWGVDFQSILGMVGTVLVRVDTQEVEGFYAYPEFAPLVSNPTDELPVFTMEALEISEPEYRVLDWATQPGWITFRRYAQVGDHEVGIGMTAIVSEPGLGQLIEIHMVTYDPPEEFSLNIDEQSAIDEAVNYIGDESLPIESVDLVYVPDRAKNSVPKYFCWEVRLGEFFVYVKCDDGTVIVEPNGPTFPIFGV